MAGNSEVTRLYLAIKTILYLCRRCITPLPGMGTPCSPGASIGTHIYL